MKTIGFPIPKKENERRRAITPKDAARLSKPELIYLESGYGDVLGFSDDDYKILHVNVVPYKKIFEHPIICNLKNPTTEEYYLFNEGQILFGWIHAVQGRKITEWLVDTKMTAIAWEEMFIDGWHVFWENNEYSGYAAIMHSFLYYGRIPNGCDVALIGRGNAARGALKALAGLGAKVTTFDRKTVKSLRQKISEYDVVVNAVLWDVFRNDHIVYKEDLAKMKKGAMIVDISCDDYMGIETSHATSIEKPTYMIDGILHYAVDHTPALLYKTATESISSALLPYLEDLTQENKNTVLEKATIIKNGRVIDERINRFQALLKG